jgi:murein DD-endopeptidase MepM/ murein hydrolase activator NlpD
VRGGTDRSRVAEWLNGRLSAAWPARRYATLLLTLGTLVGAGALGALWIGETSTTPSSTERVGKRTKSSAASVVRLDDVEASFRRSTSKPSPKASVPRVIGVGTGEFAERQTSPGDASKRNDPDVVRVDRDHPNAEPPSDAEVRRELIALEREQDRVEAALREGLGPATGTGELIWPVRGPITSPFGPRWGRLHAGMDIGVPVGTPVRAADGGRVIVRGWTGGYGNFVCIQHTRTLSTCYGHLSRYATSKGAQVRRGEVVAYSGNTGASSGPHLHFETRVNGKPVDPRRYL